LAVNIRRKKQNGVEKLAHNRHKFQAQNAVVIFLDIVHM